MIKNVEEGLEIYKKATWACHDFAAELLGKLTSNKVVVDLAEDLELLNKMVAKIKAMEELLKLTPEDKKLVLNEL